MQDTQTAPAGSADLVSLGPPDSRLPEMRWMRARVPRGRVAAATNSVPTSYSLVRAGVGLGVMTLAAAEGHPELVRLDRDFKPKPDLAKAQSIAKEVCVA